MTQPRKSSPRSARWSTTPRRWRRSWRALKSLASSQGDDLPAQAVDVKGIKVLAAVLEGRRGDAARDHGQAWRQAENRAIVLAPSTATRSLIAGVTADTIGKVKAGELVNAVAQQVGGRAAVARHGAGRRHQSGGMPAALASVKGWVEARL